jgi:predicted glycoside hydrolase/deacetylase ChbG (UPF0249 family)
VGCRLIVNADDFGLTRGINRAIGELHLAGVLTSATLMATGPAFDDAIALAQSLPTLGVGCHIVLVDGAPVSQPAHIPTLLGPDRKNFRPSLAAFTRDFFRGRIREAEIAHEAEAQIRRLQQSGIPVTHLDSHKHTHLLPAVTRALLRAMARCGVTAIRNPFEPPWSLALGHGTARRRTSLKLLSHAFERSFQVQVRTSKPPVATTGGTLAIAATGSLSSDSLAQILATLPPTGTWELVVHPGYNDSALEALPTRLRESRETERVALLHQISKRSSTLELVSYSDSRPA